MNAPSMKNAPWPKLMMAIPLITMDTPAAIRNVTIPLEMPITI